MAKRSRKKSTGKATRSNGKAPGTPAIPAKPVRKFPRISAVYSANAWQWRAIIRDSDGKQVVGKLRATQEEAYGDVDGVRRKARVGDKHALTLEEAFLAVEEDARARGIAESTIRPLYQAPAKAMSKLLDARNTQLSGMTPDSVRALVRRALEAGYKPQTIRRRHLYVLDLAFRLAELPSPVDEVKRSMAAALKSAPVLRPWFTPQELHDVLKRMRAMADEFSAYGRGWRDVHIVTLVALTGIRGAELQRAERRDIRLDRAELDVRAPKVRERPRTLPLCGPALEAARALVDSLRPKDKLIRSTRELNHLYQRWQTRLEEPRLNGRTLRHSYGTGLAMTGATMAEIRDLMGHAPDSPITARYLHSAAAHQSGAAARLAAAVAGESEDH